MTGLARRLAALGTAQWYTLLIAVSVILGLAWAMWILPREAKFDERHYVQHARDLAEGRGYIDENGDPDMYWPVGYSLALAAANAVFGQSLWVGIAQQILFTALTTVLVSLLGSRQFGPGAGRTGALLLALYPNHISYSTLYLTEPLFTLLFVAALMLVLGSLRSWRSALLAGAVLGLAILVRPAALLLPVFLLGWYIVQGLRMRALWLTILSGGATLLVLMPWLARNHAITGSWTVLSTTGGHNFWIGNYPGAFGGSARSYPAMDVLRDGDKWDYSRGYRLGMESIRQNPGEAILRTLRKAGYFFAIETDGVLWNYKGLSPQPSNLVTAGSLAITNLWYAGLLGLCVLGLLTMPWKDPLASLFLVVTLYSVVIALIFVGDPRYHYPLIPLAAIFAGKALGDLGELRQNRTLRWRWVAIMACLSALIASNLVVKVSEMRVLASVIVL